MSGPDLQSLVDAINRARKARPDEIEPLPHVLEAALGRPSRRLAVYGSLAPGRSNHHHLAQLAGTWTEGRVEGVLHDRGWGAGIGFPGISLQPRGAHVAVSVLESDDLPDHWARLDAFEGREYVRLLVPVHRDDGEPIIANIYALLTTA